MLVVDSQRNPLPDATLVSSLGQTVFDIETTDSNGLTNLVVEDGALVTAHKRSQPGSGSVFSESVTVLPGDTSLAIRHLYWDERVINPPPTVTVYVQVSGLPVSGPETFEVASSRPFVGLCAASLTPNAYEPQGSATAALTLVEPSSCERQQNGLYSVWGSNSGAGTPYFGATRDVALSTTSVSLTLTPDPGTPFLTAVQNPPAAWFTFGWPQYSGAEIGPTPSVQGTSGALTFHGTGEADSLLVQWGPTSSSANWFEIGVLPPTASTWSVDGAVHTPTLSNALVTATNGGIVSSWTVASDGSADVGYAAFVWTDSALSNSSHVWLVALPSVSGATGLTLPPLPPGFGSETPNGEVLFTVAYRQFDYVSGYAEIRDLPSHPDFFDIRESLDSTNPGSLWLPY